MVLVQNREEVMDKKANMIFVSGVPDQVRVGDRVFMQVCLMEAEDFVSGTEVTVQVEDSSVAHIMEIGRASCRERV